MSYKKRPKGSSVEDVRKGWKAANIFEALGIREATRGRGRMDGECWVRNSGSGRDMGLWRLGGGENHGGGSCSGFKVVLMEIVEGEGGY